MKKLLVILFAALLFPAIAFGSVAQQSPIDALMPATTETDFVTVWRTTADAETITLPLRTGFNYNATVDWGDGSVSTITAFDDADRIHTYATAGDYIVRISGTFEAFYFNGVGDKDKLIHVSNLGNVGWTGLGLQGAFRYCRNLVYFNGNGDISSVTSLDSVMRDWTSMTSSPDLSNWDVSSVSTLYSAMNGWSSMTSPPDLSNWDVSSVSTLRAAFYGWSSMTSSPDLSNWDVSSVSTLYYAMYGWTSMGAVDPGISAFDVQAVNNGTFFLQNSKLTTAAYDAMLINMDSLTLQSGVTWGFGSSTYTLGGAAEAARTSLINNDLLIITDGGGV